MGYMRLFPLALATQPRHGPYRKPRCKNPHIVSNISVAADKVLPNCKLENAPFSSPIIPGLHLLYHNTKRNTNTDLKERFKRGGEGLREQEKNGNWTNGKGGKI
jgi:hypothetical protein